MCLSGPNAKQNRRLASKFFWTHWRKHASSFCYRFANQAPTSLQFLQLTVAGPSEPENTAVLSQNQFHLYGPSGMSANPVSLLLHQAVPFWRLGDFASGFTDCPGSGPLDLTRSLLSAGWIGSSLLPWVEDCAALVEPVARGAATTICDNNALAFACCLSNCCAGCGFLLFMLCCLGNTMGLRKERVTLLSGTSTSRTLSLSSRVLLSIPIYGKESLILLPLTISKRALSLTKCWSEQLEEWLVPR